MIAATTMQPMTRSIRIITGRSKEREGERLHYCQLPGLTIAAGLVDVHQVALLAVADHLGDVLLQGQTEAALVPAATHPPGLVPAANLGDDQNLPGPRVGSTGAAVTEEVNQEYFNILKGRKGRTYFVKLSVKLL